MDDSMNAAKLLEMQARLRFLKEMHGKKVVSNGKKQKKKVQKKKPREKKKQNTEKKSKPKLPPKESSQTDIKNVVISTLMKETIQENVSLPKKRNIQVNTSSKKKTQFTKTKRKRPSLIQMPVQTNNISKKKEPTSVNTKRIKPSALQKETKKELSTFPVRKPRRRGPLVPAVQRKNNQLIDKINSSSSKNSIFSISDHLLKHIISFCPDLLTLCALQGVNKSLRYKMKGMKDIYQSAIETGFEPLSHITFPTISTTSNTICFFDIFRTMWVRALEYNIISSNKYDIHINNKKNGVYLMNTIFDPLKSMYLHPQAVAKANGGHFILFGEQNQFLFNICPVCSCSLEQDFELTTNIFGEKELNNYRIGVNKLHSKCKCGFQIEINIELVRECSCNQHKYEVKQKKKLKYKLLKCEACQFTVCKSCISKIECDNCKTKTCISCIRMCNSCNDKRLCQRCVYTCDKCNVSICATKCCSTCHISYCNAYKKSLLQGKESAINYQNCTIHGSWEDFDY